MTFPEILNLNHMVEDNEGLPDLTKVNTDKLLGDEQPANELSDEGAFYLFILCVHL